MSDYKQYTKELMKPATKTFERRNVNVFYNNDIWTGDLIDYSSLSKFNKGIKYLFCILDLYSRYAFVFPLKDKTSKTILNVFKSFKTYCNLFWVDRGSEFVNKEFKEFCKSKGIKIYHTNGESKAVFIERFNRTLKQKLSEYMIVNNTTKYINVLKDIVDEYNNSIHSSTKETPNSIYIDGNKSNDIAIDFASKTPKFKIGDYVRISRIKGVFEKGYVPKWSKEVFKIINVDTLYPTMYEIEDQLGEKIEGKFYEPELQKTQLKDFAMIEKVIRTKVVNGIKKYFVKYDGYDERYNEWVNEDKIEKRS